MRSTPALLACLLMAFGQGLQAGAPAAQATPSVPWLKPTKAPLVLNPYGGWIEAISFTADGSQIVADTDKTLHFLDLSLKPAREPIEGHRQMGDRPAFGPGAKQVFVTSWVTSATTGAGGKRASARAGELKVVDWARETKPLGALKAEVSSSAISADGKRVALGFENGSFQILDAATGKSLLGPVVVYKGVDAGGEFIATISAIAFSADGKRVALGDLEAQLRFFDAGTGKALGKPVGGHSSIIEVIAFCPDGSRMVTATQDMGLYVLDAVSGAPAGARLDTGNKVTALAFSPDGKRLATGHFRGDVRLWDFTPPK